MTDLEATSEQSSPLASISGVARSDIGRRREENQDSFGILENENFKMFIVADGMGGVKGGAVASSTAIAVIKEELSKVAALDEEQLGLAIHSANQSILEEAHRQPALTGMGTTCVGLAFSGTELFVVNVGDSRAYRIRHQSIQQLTEDHTLVMELLRSGTISPDQAQNHPVSHMLTRSLGPAQDLEVDCWRTVEPPRRGDIFLLCSDGLYNLVKDTEMAEIASTRPLEDAANELVALANQRGGTDNITVILVRIGDGYPIEMAPPGTPETSSEPVRERFANSENSAVPSELGAAAAPLKAAEEVNPATASSSVTSAGAAPSDAFQPQGLHRLFAARRYGLLMLGIMIGSVGVLIFGRMLQSPAPRTEVVEGPPNKLGVSESVSEVEAGQGGEAPASESASEAGGTAADFKHDAIASLSSQNPEKLGKRRDDLRARLKGLDEKIDSFDKPISGNLASILRESELHTDELQRQLERVRAEVDVATRKLAIWYQRRKRLKEGDPVNLANEIAVSSEKVREKKDEFERVTWSYLREAEVLVYDPTNTKQSEKVNELRRIRKQKKAELIDEIRAAIERSASDSDQEIIDLIAKRDKVTMNLNDARLNAEYARALMGGNEQVKAELLTELQRERETVVEELESVEQALKTLGSFSH